jgi:shikimate dehydrogenase
VIGHPIAHSRSPDIHARFAAQTGQHLSYERLLAPLDGFRETVRAFRASGGAGCNVTVPFKLEAAALADRLTDRARQAGAVNTLVFGEEGVLGDNTDGAGLVSDLTGRIGCVLKQARVLVLGAGGAVRGVIGPLLDAGVASLTVANRTAARARALQDDLLPTLPADKAQVLQAGGLELAKGRFDLIINGTSAGLNDELPVLPVGLLGQARVALDMVYGARPTAFMRLAQAEGCPQVEDGLGMLVGQAAESFYLWRGVRPDAPAVWNALRAQIQADAGDAH